MRRRALAALVLPLAFLAGAAASEANPPQAALVTLHVGKLLDGRSHDPEHNTETAAQSMLFAVENAVATVRGGITTVQSLGSPQDKDLRDWIARGTIPGPRILTSLEPLSEETGGPDQMRATVRKRNEEGADVIKIFASQSIRNGGAPTLSQEQLDAACGEAKTLGLRTAVHAHGPESVRRAVAAGCTTIEHGALLDAETLKLMADHGTWFGSFFTEELEFYHDNGGLTDRTRQSLVESVKNNICGKVYRVLVPETLEVYPLNGYGAVEIGVHRSTIRGRTAQNRSARRSSFTSGRTRTEPGRSHG